MEYSIELLEAEKLRLIKERESCKIGEEKDWNWESIIICDHKISDLINALNIIYGE